MDAFIWILLPLITAVGSALLAFYIMQARLEVVVAKEREALVEARALMKSHAREMEDKVKSAEEEARRRSLDDFLADIHVEERHYMRESKSLFSNTKSMVLQERLYFRNLPLSNWVEHELTVEHGQTADLANLARAASVFSSQGKGGAIGAQEQVDALAALASATGMSHAQQGFAQQSMVTRVEPGAPAGLTPRATGSFGASSVGSATPTRSGFGTRDSRGFAQPNSGAPKVTIEAAPPEVLPESLSRGRLSLTPRLGQSRLARG